jgi:hypothetical protein
MAERDIEKASSYTPEDEGGFEPLRGTAVLPNTVSRTTSRARSLSRLRSNNGYGCDDHDGDTTSPEPEPDKEKDPFEVEWDGGDNDPMCPRKFGTLRKWVIVCIVSFASLCV